MEKGGFHIIVAKDDGPAFFFEFIDFIGQLSFVFELDFGYDAIELFGHLLIGFFEGCGGECHCVGSYLDFHMMNDMVLNI